MIKGVDYTGLAVVCFCHDGNGNYVVEQRSDKCRDEHFTWGPVGSGGVDRGERLEDTVRHEIREECGATALEIEFLGFREVFRGRNDQQTHWVFFDYKVRIDPSEVRITEPEKCLEQRWVTIDAIPEPKHSQFPVALEKYREVL